MMEIPEGWSFERLDSHIDLLSGFAFKSAQYSEDTSDIKLLRGANVSQGNLRWLDVKYWPASETQELARYRLEAGDIVVSMDRTWIPAGLKVAVVKSSDLPSLLVQRVARLRAKSTLTQGLLATIIQSNRFVGHVKKTQTETAVPHISPKDIRDYKVYIAPLPEQQKIAKILRTWDRAIAATKALITASEAQKKALMQQLLTGKRRLPGFEGEWRDVKMSKLGDVTSGGTPKSSKSEYWDGTIPWLTPTDVTSLKSDFVDVTPRMITMSGVESSSAKLLPVGSLLVCTRATIGAMAINTVPMATNQGFKNITPNSDCDIQFLLLLLKQKKNDLLRLGCGSTFLEVSKSDFSKLELNVPPVEEQVAVRMVIDNAEQQRLSLAAKLQTLKTEKAALMQQLLTGKRRVKLTEAA